MLFVEKDQSLFSGFQSSICLSRSAGFNNVGVLLATIGLRRQLGRLAVDNQRSKIHPEDSTQD